MTEIKSNMFALFGLPVQFDLDVVALDQRYLAAQATVHPDLFVGRSDLEKRLAAQQAITLNEAYQRLKNVPTRAEEFLKAKNIPVPGTSGATVPASDLLGQVLEWREQIQEGTGLHALKDELTLRLQGCLQCFDTAPDDQLAHCYLNLIYTQKTLSELEYSS